MQFLQVSTRTNAGSSPDQARLPAIIPVGQVWWQARLSQFITHWQIKNQEVKDKLGQAAIPASSHQDQD